MDLGKGLIVDSRGNTDGIGQYVIDLFNKSLTNIDWRVNNKNKPDCLIGYANKPIEPGTRLVCLKGKEFWCARGQWETLAPKQKAACRAMYDISDSDIYD